MAFGQSGAQGCLAIFSRIAGNERGAAFTKLSTQTIRAVAQGVLGVALIQAIIIGFCLIIAGVPWAGALSAIVLVLGIAQLPALLVTLPAIVYIWSSGDYGNFEAILFSALLFIAGVADNILKPLLLGRGVEAPMPVILIGALAAWQPRVSSACLSAPYCWHSATRFSWLMPTPGCRYRQCAERHYHCRLGGSWMTTCSALRPGSKIVDQNLENAPAGENEMTLLGPGGSSGWAVSHRSSAGVAGSDRARYGLSQVRSYGGGGWGSSLAVTGKWSEG